MRRKYISGFMSAIIMGSGQMIHRSWARGLGFFLIQLILVLNVRAVSRGLWGLITLGETAQRMEGFSMIPGDHSIFLLVEGVFILTLLIAFIAIYVMNVRDALTIGAEFDRRRNAAEHAGNTRFRDIFDRNFGYLMLIPGASGVVFFVLLPVVITALIAFTNYSAPNHIPPRNLVDWVGLGSFSQVFSYSIYRSTITRLALWNVLWAVMSTVTTFGMGMLLALILSDKRIRFRTFWRGVFILPMAIPAFVSLLVFRLMFNGLGPINSMLIQAGFDKIPFLTETWPARIIVILINIWISTPFFMLLISGVLSNINRSMYEAADIDGAGAWAKFSRLTLPHILYQTIPVIIMQFAFSFNNFGAVYLVTEGRPVNSSLRYAGDTDILVSWLYKLTLEQNQYHIAAVISLIIFLVISMISLYSFVRSSSFRNEGGLG
jgi:arabinogalactan oligomer/maltooligosaccharide transport system permease protein